MILTVEESESPAVDLRCDAGFEIDKLYRFLARINDEHSAVAELANRPDLRESLLELRVRVSEREGRLSDQCDRQTRQTSSG